MPFVTVFGNGVCWPCEHARGPASPLPQYRDAVLDTSSPRARIEMVSLEANHEYPGGTILGQVTRSGQFAPYNAALIAPGAAPVLTQGDAGALGAGVYGVQYTYLDALGGESLPSLTEAIIIAANKEIHVAAITPLPQGAVSVNWYLSDAPGSAVLRLVAQNAGSAFDLNVLPAGANPESPLTPGAFQYADGRHEARAIQKYPAQTNADGEIFVGQDVDLTMRRSEWGAPVSEIEVWWSGVFQTSELIGLDARAVAQLGRMLNGVIGNGKLCVYGA